MQGYEEIFNQRGNTYHFAMAKYPDARAGEFEAALKKLHRAKGSCILDLPAGGGYMQRFLEDDVNYLAYDFSGEFDDHHTGIKKCKESKIDIDDESIDEVVSLAALHHIVSREEFYAEMHRVLKPNGQLVIGDVPKGGKQDYFLNVFLNQYNSMGHDGRFIEEKDILEIEAAGFAVEVSSESFDWVFASESDAMDFFRLLFCLDLNPSNQLLHEELKKLGVEEAVHFCVKWGLTFLTCKKN